MQSMYILSFTGADRGNEQKQLYMFVQIQILNWTEYLLDRNYRWITLAWTWFSFPPASASSSRWSHRRAWFTPIGSCTTARCSSLWWTPCPSSVLGGFFGTRLASCWPSGWRISWRRPHIRVIKGLGRWCWILIQWLEQKRFIRANRRRRGPHWPTPRSFFKGL
jgi:hypothetical protein